MKVEDKERPVERCQEHYRDVENLLKERQDKEKKSERLVEKKGGKWEDNAGTRVVKTKQKCSKRRGRKDVTGKTCQTKTKEVERETGRYTRR